MATFFRSKGSSRFRYRGCLSSANDKFNVSCSLPRVPSFLKRTPDTMKLTLLPPEYRKDTGLSASRANILPRRIFPMST